MKNQLRVEVEPLSDQRWTKLERALMTRVEDDLPDQQQPVQRHGGVGLRAWLAAAALVGALAAVMLVFLWLPEPVAVDHPSRITTGLSATHLALPGLTLDVEPQSAVVLSSETAQGVLLVLDRGSIVCEVAPRSRDAPLFVQAGAARVRVIGTRFSVARSGESARVVVYPGVVVVTA
jgi:transmembrane sensor